jgi:hypothetical protein
MNKSLLALFIPIIITLASCVPISQTVVTVVPSDESPIPTATSLPIPTVTVAPTNTPRPTPTAVYQQLGEIYSSEYNQKPIGIVSALSIGIADSQKTHFDIGIPDDMDISTDPVISPITGKIVELLFLNSDGTCQPGGCALSISPDFQIIGTENIYTKYGIKVSTITPHLGHLMNLSIKLGDHVIQGQPLGYVADLRQLPIGWINRISWVILANSPNQFSPCDINPSLSFCGLCYSRSLQKDLIDDKSIYKNTNP